MRGKHVEALILVGQHRITPAHAGKTIQTASNLFPRQDHPRACGENHSVGALIHELSGSPPRMRGKRRNSGQKADIIRITPAHAGKTLTSFPVAPLPRDHPRACGENPSCRKILKIWQGSPPRMRGKPKPEKIFQCHPRITPAHAGKTWQEFLYLSFDWDHPRACGENSSSASSPFIMSGSPPRMRGKRPSRFV